MDPRRTFKVIDPKVRHVGFFAPPSASPEGTQSGRAGPSSPASVSPSGKSLSPVMIPPPHHASEKNLSSLAVLHQAPPSRPVGVPVPAASRRLHAADDAVVVGSYNPVDSVLESSSSGISPLSSRRIGDGEFSEDSVNWIRRSSTGKLASSVPSGGLNLAINKTPVVSDKDIGQEKDAKTPNELESKSKPLKEKTTKAERRALQESQRAAKAAAKGRGKKYAAASGVALGHASISNNVQQPLPKKDVPHAASSSVAISEKKGGGDRPLQKERKKDVPPPRMQFDDKSRVEKAKRHAVVRQSEAKNRVELFRHLPQYEHGNQLPDLEAKFFELDPMHPAVYKVGLQYLAGDIYGANARCMAMLEAFCQAIRDYSTPPEKAFSRDLTAKINSYISFLIECRPLSISMGNAIRFLKARIAKLPLSLSETEAKTSLCADIDHFINEKIVLAGKVIVKHAFQKIRDGDVLLTYGSSSVVEMIISHAHELGKQFRVVVVDSRPKLEGQALLRRLVRKGISCTYTHINAVSYIMHEVTRVFLGAASVLSNGTVYSRVGTACVAMVAHAYKVPVLICCEAYKFHERVQLDSICSNELGDPHVIAKVQGRMDVNYLENWTGRENLQLLNLLYDATPSDYVSMIITDYGMIPPTSVPVIVREYGKAQLFV